MSEYKKPLKVLNPFDTEAEALIKGFYAVAESLQLTGMKKKKWQSSYYKQQLKFILSYKNWLKDVHLPLLLEENRNRPPKERVLESEIQKRLLPFYWKSSWTEAFLLYRIDEYHEQRLTGKRLMNYVYFFENYRILYRDLSGLKVKIPVEFKRSGIPVKYEKPLRGKVAIGDINYHYLLMEENNVVTSDDLAHGLKIDRSMATRFIEESIPLVNNYGKRYNAEIQAILRFQMLVGSRLQFTLKIKKQDVEWFEDDDCFHLPAPLSHKVVGRCTIYFAKGGLTRTVFLTEEVKTWFYPRWERLPQGRSPLFQLTKPVTRHGKTNYEVMDLETAMRIIQKIINHASLLGGYTSKQADPVTVIVPRPVREFVGEVRDSKGNITKQGRWEVVRVVDEETGESRVLYKDTKITRFIKYSINSHSFRKCYCGYWFHQFYSLSYEDLEKMLSIHASYQKSTSIEQMKKRLELQYKRLNDHVYARKKENNRRLKAGEDLLPDLDFIGYNHVNLAELVVSLLSGHTRHSVVSSFYVDIPEEYKREAKSKSMKLAIKRQALKREELPQNKPPQ